MEQINHFGGIEKAMDKKRKALLRPSEVRELLGLSRERVGFLIEDGLLPHVIVSGTIRIPVRALNVWLKGLEVSALSMLQSKSPSEEAHDG